MKITKADLLPELKFFATRSSGSGGQHVNKVSTRIEAVFVIHESAIFSEDEKIILAEKLKNKISKAGELRVTCDTERSQYLNKQQAIQKIHLLLINAFKVQKPRKSTNPTKGSVRERLKNKEFLGDKKLMRKKVNPKDL